VKKLLAFCLFSSISFASYAQNNRIKDKNSIGWYAFNGSLKMNSKWSLAGEFQWRRDNTLSDPQQTVYKFALNHLAAPGLNIRAGVALAETYNYGDIPVNGMGKQFTEYRSYQMVSLSNKIGLSENTHRFMLEQRWVGRYTDPSLTKEDEYVYTNRLRYMYRLQVPLKGTEITDKTPYAAVYDEVLVGFGKNVGENVFDQNRFGLLLGYRFSPKVRIEGGFLSQIAQLGREVDGKNVFQYNNGLILSTNLSF
jgi:hypothetical protein